MENKNKTSLTDLLGRVTVGSTPVNPTVMKEIHDRYDIKDFLGEYVVAHQYLCYILFLH